MTPQECRSRLIWKGESGSRKTTITADVNSNLTAASTAELNPLPKKLPRLPDRQTDHGAEERACNQTR
jgi:hypothetical protein